MGLGEEAFVIMCKWRDSRSKNFPGVTVSGLGKCVPVLIFLSA